MFAIKRRDTRWYIQRHTSSITVWTTRVEDAMRWSSLWEATEFIASRQHLGMAQLVLEVVPAHAGRVAQ